MAKRYTVYNTDTNTVEATGRPYPVADGVSEPVGMPINLVLLEEIRVDRPAYDSATHKLVEDAIAYDTTAKTATRSWSAVALTQAEIDERTPEHYETSTGIKMAIDVQSQAAFSNMMILLNEAGMADTDPVAIKDCFGVSHGMTVAEFRTQAVAYGLHCYTIFHS
jgi:hypothetical protein